MTMSQNPLPSPIDISVAQAQQQIQEAMVPLLQRQEIDLQDGLNRILAHDIIAARDVPSFDNSAMDGYAFCAKDLSMHQELTIVGQSQAGHPFHGRLQPGQAIRITTGAVIPDYADSVLPQELAVLKNASTLLMEGIHVHPGQHKRCRGEEIAAGGIVLGKGTRLGPVELGLLASLGLSAIQVQRKLKVAIFSTGDELRSPGQTADLGSIFDSNRITLRTLLQQFGADVLDLGVLADNHDTIQTALKNCADQADVIITSGGVSVGAADFTRQVMQQVGRMNFWSVNMRPGRPLAFGTIDKNQQTDKTYLFGLPGNPVAMLVSFYFFVRPALQLLYGSQISMTPSVSAAATQAIAKKAGRTEFQRGIFTVDPHGRLEVSITGHQGSGMLSSMARANCLVVLTPEQGDIEVGDTVRIMLFEGLI
jgi:molybdopterin molybdotransferase